MAYGRIIALTLLCDVCGDCDNGARVFQRSGKQRVSSESTTVTVRYDTLVLMKTDHSHGICICEH